MIGQNVSQNPLYTAYAQKFTEWSESGAFLFTKMNNFVIIMGESFTKFHFVLKPSQDCFELTLLITCIRCVIIIYLLFSNCTMYKKELSDLIEHLNFDISLFKSYNSVDLSYAYSSTTSSNYAFTVDLELTNASIKGQSTLTSL